MGRWSGSTVARQRMKDLACSETTPHFYCYKYINGVASLYSLSVCTLPRSYLINNTFDSITQPPRHEAFFREFFSPPQTRALSLFVDWPVTALSKISSSLQGKGSQCLDRDRPPNIVCLSRFRVSRKILTPL